MFRKDRSDEPIYWGLFGAGGMVIAIILPIVVLAAIVSAFCESAALNFMYIATNPILGFGLVVCLILSVWHCLHRVYHGLHDLTIHTNVLIHIAIYGLALLLSVAFLVFFIIGETTDLPKVFAGLLILK